MSNKQEEKALLLRLLKEADADGNLYIYDKNENFYSCSWIFADGNDIIIKIENP